MLSSIQAFLAETGIDQITLMLAFVGLGSMIGLVGLYGGLTETGTAARRFRPAAGGAGAPVPGSDLLKQRSTEPSRLLKALIPVERAQRTRVERELAHAGMIGKNAVVLFFTTRALLGVGLPAMVFGLPVAAPVFSVPVLTAWVSGLSQLEMFQVLAVLGAAGFYGPTYWLKAKVNARKQRVSEAFPNALDLLQIGVEAGLGFDAAMARVADEIEKVAPEIAYEFRTVQQEILAGRDRDKALLEMADRMNIDEAVSFVNVVLQSKRFGTSVSDALLTYANEMRHRRELAAQEKANRLPVQMSAVMGFLMLPALFMISLTPVVIRYMRYFAEG